MLTAMLVLMVASVPAAADICVKHHTVTEAYEHEGEMVPEIERDYQVWFGNGKVAYDYSNIKMLVDVSKNTLVFVNKDDSTYLETTIPVKWEDIVVEEDLPRIRAYRTAGEIEELGEEKELEGRQCAGYYLKTWIPFEEETIGETESVIWYTDDVPFDMDLYRQVHPCILTLRNFTPDFIERMGEYTDYPVRIEETRNVRGTKIRTVNTIEEICTVDAPEDLWKVPEGFTEKERITIQDIQGQ